MVNPNTMVNPNATVNPNAMGIHNTMVNPNATVNPNAMGSHKTMVNPNAMGSHTTMGNPSTMVNPNTMGSPTQSNPGSQGTQDTNTSPENTVMGSHGEGMKDTSRVREAGEQYGGDTLKQALEESKERVSALRGDVAALQKVVEGFQKATNAILQAMVENHVKAKQDQGLALDAMCKAVVETNAMVKQMAQTVKDKLIEN